MSVNHVWIFDDRPQSPAVGVWITESLLAQPDPAGILRMSVIARQTAARSAGITPERHGFADDVYATVAARAWRGVENKRIEFAREVVFVGGIFLMFGSTLAPSEVESPETAYEVREVLGAPRLVQLRPLGRAA